MKVTNAAFLHRSSIQSSLVREGSNKGIVHALNCLIESSLSWGTQYIARMDADDIAMPDRLERQLSFLESRPDVTVVGGAVKMFKSGTTLVKSVQYPSSSGSVHFGMFYNCILVHPTIVFRASLFSNNASSSSTMVRYSDNFRFAEDYALWLHLIEAGNVKLDNIENPPILRLRKHTANESTVHGDRQKAAARLALKTVLDRLIKRHTKEDEVWSVSPETVDSILTGYHRQTTETLSEAFKVTEIIEAHLLAQSIFSESDRRTIKEDALKQYGALATMEMRSCPDLSPSALFCWSRWLSKKPASGLSNLLGMAYVSSALDSSKSTPAPQSSASRHRVTVICFSKDRAFQMQEYMRTLEAYVIRSSPSIDFDVHIIWRATTLKFQKSYLKLASDFATGATPNTTYNWIEESNCTQHLSDAVKSASPYILWGVDDVLYYNPTDVSEFIEIMEKDKKVLCATLRLSPNVTYCHPSNAHSKLPSFNVEKDNLRFHASDSDADRIFPSNSASSSAPSTKRVFEQEILRFDRSTATEDWNYPFELCATLMHKDMVSDILLSILQTNGLDGMSHPNKLEVTGSRLFTQNLTSHAKLTSCLCLKNPVLSVITINRVQDVCENRIYDEISLDELELHLDQGRRLDLAYYRNHTFDAVHIGDFVLLEEKST